VALKVDDQLINGDGTGNNLKGLIASATTYVPAAAGIPSPTIYDLIVKVKAAITSTGGSKYMPNFVLMNNEDICAMDLSKDGNNNYIMPPFVSRDGETVKGLRVIEDNAIPANQLVVGDANYGRIYAAAGLTMSRGTIDKQFVEDAMTLKVRRRLALLIREADKTGFYHVADIDAALVTIGS
jgi:HK97 family phage major capsid protein